jgi:hypothetical protein
MQHRGGCSELHKFGRKCFGHLGSLRIVFAVFSAVFLILISFAFTPLLWKAFVEQDNNLTNCGTNIQEQTYISKKNQSENLLSISAVPQKSAFKVISYSRPSAVLSLSGTLGDNGWYTSNVEASFYITGDETDTYTIEYTFYNQEWRTYSEPFIIFEEGQTSFYYRVRNSTGFTWETTMSTVDLDKTSPHGTVLIEEGATEIFSTSVNLTISVADEPSGPTTLPPPGYFWGVPSGPSVIRFSNDGIHWSSWGPIANQKSWITETGAGIKTVYGQVRDNAGLVSEPFSDTINLVTTKDSLPPVTKILVNGKKDTSGVYTSAAAITLTATDDLSGVVITEYSYTGQNWTKYTGALPLYTEGETTIYFRSHDANGNVESTNSQKIEIRKIEDPNPFLPLALGITTLFVVIAIAVVLVRRKRNRKN